MKWAVIAVVAFACLGQGFGRAAPICVSLEYIELDYTKCPELAARFQPREGYVGIAERRDAKFADLEKKAAKRVLVHHVEWIEPGTKVNHVTRINETTFALNLAIKLTGKGNYAAAVHAEWKQGCELPASVKPGTQLTPAQMKAVEKGIDTRQTTITLRLSPGQSWVIGGKDAKASTITALIVGVGESGPAESGSR